MHGGLLRPTSFLRQAASGRPVSRLFLHVQTDLQMAATEAGGRVEFELRELKANIEGLRGHLSGGVEGVMGVDLTGQDLAAGLINPGTT